MTDNELKKCKEFLDFYGVDYNANPIVLTDGGNSCIVTGDKWKEFIGFSVNSVAKAVAKKLNKKSVYKSDYELDNEYENKQITKYLQNKEPVNLYHNNETGIWQWSISVVINPEFWIDSFKYKKEAIDFCEKHKLKINKLIYYGDEK